jgi:uncharacterized membrane protein
MDQSSHSSLPPSVPSTTGLSTNAAGFLAYCFLIIGPIVLLMVEKKDQEVKFHAAQSLVLTLFAAVVFMLLGFFLTIPILNIFVAFVTYPLAVLFFFILWVVLMIRTYQGRRLEVPFICQFVPAQFRA